MNFTYIIFSMQRTFCVEVRQKTVVYLPIINLEKHIMHQNVCLSVCYHLDMQHKKFIFFIFLEIDICSCITFFCKYSHQILISVSWYIIYSDWILKDFEREHSDNPNFKLWSSYMSMVEILLDFTWAEREGNWNLHLEAFAAMLPWLTIFDHANYTKWDPIYLAEMKNLENTAPEVYAEFMNGNFVLKRSKRRFNQVPAGQATEWINKTCKMQNGIKGITRNDQARDRFCVTWSERTQISEDTRHLFGLEDDEEESSFTRFDSLASRRVRDADDVAKLYTS